MAKHLSSEEFERVISGRADTNALRHVQECGACLAELTMLQAMLAGVKDSAVRAADRQRLLAAVPAMRSGRRNGWLRGGMWAGAMAVVLVAAVVPVEMRHRVKPPARTSQQVPGQELAGQQAASTTELSLSISDDALLNGVQNDLSSTVPAPLEPLAGPATTATSITSSNAGDTKE